ncbi:hypothetical protein [Lysinibacillus sphaericus]|uniref:Uncharacterized protein n=1 Tax=Lysinibacillus sphaericus OT4b.31 TaxID=1285586 RepID=R7ZE00_LYSSH|nr:hypothetical protein [Lysinibacillus sphaericus]EON72231.1 hypothetical protein H131_11658 [Lysinibacillus sphaericus OT4b.31]
MKDYLKTINYDLHGLKKLILEGSNSLNFSSGPVFSIFRDICIALYETNKVLKKDSVILSDLPQIEVIEEIRNKVKTNQGFQNREIFNKLLDGHKSIFGDDIDNLGFYIDNNTLASSTLFPTFVFANTHYLNTLFNEYDSNDHTNLDTTIASLIQVILALINQPIHLDSKPFKNINEKEYVLKDVWDKRFYTEDIIYNVLFTRLLLIQNELTTCTWLENHLDYQSPKFNLDKYILLRLTSIKLFETMRNLLDMRDRAELQEYWIDLNLNSLDYLLDEYENTFGEEMKTLRNMLHYNNMGINFYDYLQQQIQKDNEYPDKLLKVIFKYTYEIRRSISDTINIQSYKSMSDLEKISCIINSST